MPRDYCVRDWLYWKDIPKLPLYKLAALVMDIDPSIFYNGISNTPGYEFYVLEIQDTDLHPSYFVRQAKSEKPMWDAFKERRGEVLLRWMRDYFQVGEKEKIDTQEFIALAKNSDFLRSIAHHRFQTEFLGLVLDDITLHKNTPEERALQTALGLFLVCYVKRNLLPGKEGDKKQSMRESFVSLMEQDWIKTIVAKVYAVEDNETLPIDKVIKVMENNAKKVGLYSYGRSLGIYK
jgi:hypothetical protein